MNTSRRVTGIGVDVVEIESVRNARHKKRFAEYFLTKKEIARIPKGPKEAEFLASRFAAKEAVIKAFPGKLSPHDFTIEKKGVRPSIAFSAKKRALMYTVDISISHTAHTAVAIAMVVRNR